VHRTLPKSAFPVADRERDAFARVLLR